MAATGGYDSKCRLQPERDRSLTRGIRNYYQVGFISGCTVPNVTVLVSHGTTATVCCSLHIFHDGAQSPSVREFKSYFCECMQFFSCTSFKYSSNSKHAPNSWRVLLAPLCALWHVIYLPRFCDGNGAHNALHQWSKCPKIRVSSCSVSHCCMFLPAARPTHAGGCQFLVAK